MHQKQTAPKTKETTFAKQVITGTWFFQEILPSGLGFPAFA